MAFNSLIFLGWFLPFFLLIYYLSPGRCRNIVIFLFNIIFIVYGSINAPLCLASTFIALLFNYILAILIDKTNRQAFLPGFLLFIGVVANLGMLFTYKYMNPFTDALMPVGLSFYTFQSIAYIADVKTKKTFCEKNLLHYLNYMLLFPQLVAGPILRHSDHAEALRTRVFNKKKFVSGIEEFILGLAIKSILADQLGGLWNKVEAIGYDSISTPMAWLGIVTFSLQLYLDFAGYSMMAIGLGRLFGFEIPVNFNYPYISTTMTEFWRRWHITLGSWFRDYLYIPLGGNRKGKLRTTLNMLAVWLFTGIWHGIEWNFIAWGLFLFIVMFIEKNGLGKFMNKHRFVGHIYMIILIPVSWMLFAVHSISGIGVYALRLVGAGGVNVFAGDFAKYIGQYGPFLFFALLCSTKLPRLIYKKLPTLLKVPVLLALLGFATYMVYLGENNPFMYFSF